MKKIILFIVTVLFVFSCSESYARYYDSKGGRFLSTDPLGYHDSMNLYVYVVNNPINYIDPYGLAYQYKRPLDSTPAQIYAAATYGDYSGGQLYHAGFVYDDGKTHGYYGNSTTGEDPGSIDVMQQMEEYGPKLDDDILRQAEKNIEKQWNRKANPKAPGYNLFKHNCQDYAQAVLEEYRRLLEKAKKNKKGVCK